MGRGLSMQQREIMSALELLLSKVARETTCARPIIHLVYPDEKHTRSEHASFCRSMTRLIERGLIVYGPGYKISPDYVRAARDNGIYQEMQLRYDNLQDMDKRETRIRHQRQRDKVIGRQRELIHKATSGIRTING